MATKVDKKNAIRQGITEAEIGTLKNWQVKHFCMFVEMNILKFLFQQYYFLHLTGVETRLSTKDFYKNAKKSILTK